MGRAPCCDKANVKKGPWSPEEDVKLKTYMEKYGTRGNWIALPQKIGLKRCGKSCRLRWLNYLRPNIKHGGFSEEEDNIICNLYMSIGSRWSIIAAQLPGRTDNDVKNYWNTKLKKKLLGRQVKGADEHNQFPHGLTNSALERLQLHIQLQNPFSNFYNNPTLWPKVNQNGMQSVLKNPGDFHYQPAQQDNHLDNLMGSKTVAMAGGMVEPVSNFKAELVDELLEGKACSHAPREGQMAQLDSFNEMNGSKDSMVWWSNGFDAKSSVSSNCWGSTSVLQFNEMFQDYELGYNV
ncbi:hypothetical protein HRI_005228200 [Hibiscus trionum]|uniref:Uncharacterized protein n=1 Tax=Hibiscus trionum TaxID=183268 RepID=A0A9W7JJB5_HIBTR|nr:hypothetical protein HRI_005228200 [Hibiscus trionum]